MDPVRMNCPHCKAEVLLKPDLAGPPLACPICGGRLPVDAPPPPAAAAGQFPERMKANRALMGRTCSGCSQPIELGQDVFNCPSCAQTMHQSCHQASGGCVNEQCPRSVVLKADGPPPVAEPAPPPEGLVECRVCGEPIRRNASRCRHCGEPQSELARAEEERSKKMADADDSLTVAEIIFGLLCGLIACIMGLVWALQGKKKGWKLIAIAVLSQLVLGVIRAILTKDHTNAFR